MRTTRTALPIVRAMGVVAAFLWAKTTQAQAPVLHVYYLTDSQRATFSSEDSLMAPFWTEEWDGRDSLWIFGPDDCAERCDVLNAADGSMAVRTAGDGDGLYLLFRIRDNVWIPRQVCSGPYGDILLGDELFFLLDPLSPDSLRDSAAWLTSDTLYGEYCTLTPRTLALRIWTGDLPWMSTLITTRYSSRPISWHHGGTQVSYPARGEIRSDSLVWDWGEQDDHRWFELYIPWTLLGQHDESWRSNFGPGTRFSLWAGYGDMDSWCIVDWLEKPYSCPFGTTVPGEEWGALELADPAAGYSWTSTSSIRRPMSTSAIPGRTVEPVSWYTVTGRRLGALGVESRGTGIVIRRRGTECAGVVLHCGR
jgi:hypothetical protein